MIKLLFQTAFLKAVIGFSACVFIRLYTCHFEVSTESFFYLVVIKTFVDLSESGRSGDKNSINKNNPKDHFWYKI